MPQRAWYRSAQGGDAVALRVEQGGAEDVLGAAVGVLDQAQRDRSPLDAGMLAAQLAQGGGAGEDLGDGVGKVAGDEAVEGVAGLAADAEDGLQAALAMGAEQLERVVAAVVDEQVRRCQGPQMGRARRRARRRGRGGRNRRGASSAAGTGS